MNPISTLACIAIAGYLGVSRTVRWRRYNEMHRRYQAKFENKSLTPEEAQEIVQLALMYDMPSATYYSYAFALFKTYAIPSISGLLLATKEFSTEEKVSRRYIDTVILIATWAGCPISGFLLDPVTHAPKREGEADPRAMISMARTNWLHSRYKISNDDYLYTLSLFVTEPAAWTHMCGWRPLSPLEEYAHYVLWAELGRRMGIKDIPESLEELKSWARRYEEGYMIPADSNRKVAELTMDELLSFVPKEFGLRTLGEKICISLLEDRVRIAMGYSEQPWYIHLLVRFAMSAFAFVTQWSLPRKKSGLSIKVEQPPIVPGVCPRLHPNRYPSKPWYRPEPTGIWYIITWVAVKLGYFRSMPAPELKSKGYRLEELGPIHLEREGHEEVMKMAEELQGYPITGPWSLEGRDS